MIERIYIDNFRTLVNFEWKPGRLALLLGNNGSGKSSVVDALWGIRALIADYALVRKPFPRTSRARWEQRLEQRFEIDAKIGQHTYNYKLVIEHFSDNPNRSRVRGEFLQADETVLLTFADGKLQFFADDGAAFPSVTGDDRRSGLAAVAQGMNYDRLTAFKQWIVSDVWLIRPDPCAMSSRTDEEGDWLHVNAANFSSWFPRWMSQDFHGLKRGTELLESAINGFRALQVNRAAPKLEASFQLPDGHSYSVDFTELSEGQRQLCALYFIRQAVVKPGRLVIFDEPDNYLALREIQPWLAELVDAALSAQGPQVWFISHHPEVLNELAPQHGTRFFRDGGPTRIEPFRGVDGLTAAETIARGWEHD